MNPSATGALRLRGSSRFAGVPHSAGSARAYARDLLADAVPATTLHDVTLAVSELVTNAVVHSDSGLPGGSVTVVVTLGAAIRVEVTDAGCAGHRPEIARDVEPDATSGRGLRLVQALSARWGVFPVDSAGPRTVWCEIPVGDRPA
ncbi:ATP-binding protein [Rhizohabitans arisaemae]|uniref:ATP-binding protein n=1 Tax=Rhizohabitans arisaemae TaxID=2720610 RepID=UPI0024B0B83F|nr:ATP-binding protein [Rhizohabitans arisaemae]